MLLTTSLSYLAILTSLVVTNPVTALGLPNGLPKGKITICNNQMYKYQGLAGWGALPSNARDKYGETIGGIGSAIAFKSGSWKFSNGIYTGVVYCLPDRGWSTRGTENTQSRIHKFRVKFQPVRALPRMPAKQNFQFQYLDTILLYGPDNQPLTGLDPTGIARYPGHLTMPIAEYWGDGFGGPGPGGRRVALDAEGLVLKKGKFWISDEYTGNIYAFDSKGKMKNSLRTPPALTPQRHGIDSFNSGSPPAWDPYRAISPVQPDVGRTNNHGLEGLTSSPGGSYIYAMLESATVQDNGISSKTRRNTRLFIFRKYKQGWLLRAEYIVRLPVLSDGQVAIQSELLYVSPNQFLVLVGDSNAGRGRSSSRSLYRNIDIIDISTATNLVHARANELGGKIVNSQGEFQEHVLEAEYCPWLNINNNEQLARFGLHNDGPQDYFLLNEKWESMALVPVHKDDYIGRTPFSSTSDGTDRQFYLITFSDNQYITQDGYLNGGMYSYSDNSGLDIETQALVFKVKLPTVLPSDETYPSHP